MALSQMHAGKMLVPWFNFEEWKFVYSLIYCPVVTRKDYTQALQILRMWKLRTPKLPQGVEGTLIVLDALLQDPEMIPQDKIRIVQGAAVMRFLNLCGASGDKQGTFYKTAKENNIPDWLVDLRHVVAHDQIIPSEGILRRALEFCLGWLERQYWKKQLVTLSDYVIPEGPRMETVMDLYCMIVLKYNYCGIKYLNDDTNIIKIFNTIKNIQIDLNMEIEDVLAVLLSTLNNMIPLSGGSMSEVFVANGSMFHVDYNVSEKQPTGFARVWENILNLFYRNNILSYLINELFNVIAYCEISGNKAILATLWLIEIFKGLILHKTVGVKYNELTNPKTIDKIGIKQVFLNQNTDFQETLVFNGDCCEDISDQLQAMKIYISQYSNIYSKSLRHYFFWCYKLYTPTTDVEIDCSSTFVEENSLDDRLRSLDTSIPALQDNADFENLKNVDTTQQSSEPDDSKYRFAIVQDTSIFKGCPLGVLNNQSRDMNPFL